MSKKQEHKPVGPAKLGSPGRPNSRKARQEALAQAKGKKPAAQAKGEISKAPTQTKSESQGSSSKSGG